MSVKSLTTGISSRLAAVPNNALGLGFLGAFVGGIYSAATNSYKVAKGEMSKVDAVTDVAQETMGTGLATAAGATAMTLLGVGGLVGLAGMVAVASLTKGAWNKAMSEGTRQPAKQKS